MRRLIATLVSSSNVRGKMKSTYFLPGRYWDNKPLYKGKIDVGCAACYYGDPNSPDSLFDIDGKKRQVSLSRLFAIDTYQQFAESVTDLVDCADIGVNVDYLPRVSIPVHWVFFVTRLLQMLEQLHEVAPKARLHVLVSDSSHMPVFRCALLMLKVGVRKV